MQSNITKALLFLYPRLNISDLADLSLSAAKETWPHAIFANYIEDVNEHLIRFDEPLPEGFTPPTQAAIDVAIITMVNVNTITNAQLKRQLNATGQLATAQQLVMASGGLIMELWYGAATFHITDPELIALATTRLRMVWA